MAALQLFPIISSRRVPQHGWQTTRAFARGVHEPWRELCYHLLGRVQRPDMCVCVHERKGISTRAASGAWERRLSHAPGVSKAHFFAFAFDS